MALRMSCLRYLVWTCWRHTIESILIRRQGRYAITSGKEGKDVVPLGVFAVISLADHPEQAHTTLQQLVGEPEHDEDRIAEYLRRGSIVLALMEHTRDLIGPRFATPGGSAILTDGIYFWRMDTASYVETYHVKLPHDFLVHGRSRGWTPTTLSETEMIDADRSIVSYYRNKQRENRVDPESWAVENRPEDSER
jgi:hypothetical protein